MKNNRIIRGALCLLLIIILIAIDQIIKIQVKTGMCLHESIRITDWFQIVFIENKGMAWGMTFFNKYILSTFRLVAIAVLSWYIVKQIKQEARTIYLILLSMVVAGAAGNIVDCVFYGQIFTESTPWQPAQFVPFGQGYAPVLLGKVVDMWYFPLLEFDWPLWMPIVGGDHFIFFSPIFNTADAYISVAVISLILFCRKELSFSEKKQ